MVRPFPHSAAHFARINRPLPEPLENYIHSTPGQDDPESFEPLALRPEDWPKEYAGGERTAAKPTYPLITSLETAELLIQPARAMLSAAAFRPAMPSLET